MTTALGRFAFSQHQGYYVDLEEFQHWTLQRVEKFAGILMPLPKGNQALHMLAWILRLIFFPYPDFEGPIAGCG